MFRKIQNKRIYLKSISIASIPLVLVSSCTTNISNFNIQIDDNKPEDNVTTNEILTIGSEFLEINISKLITIKKLFSFSDDLNQSVINGLKVKAIETDNRFQLVLQAEEGFTINNGLEQILSQPFNVYSDKIKINLKKTEEINQAKITNFDIAKIETTGNQTIDIAKFNIIKNVFDFGKISSNFIENSLWIKRTDINKNTHTLTLIPKPGYYINDLDPEEELTSLKFNSYENGVTVIDFEVEPILENLIISHEEIYSISEEVSLIHEPIIIILKKLFNFGEMTNQEIQNAFKIQRINENLLTNKLNLIANDGYTINGSKNLESNHVIASSNFIIDKKTKEEIESEITQVEINSIDENLQNIDIAKLSIIKKVFSISEVNRISFLDEKIMAGLKIKKVISPLTENSKNFQFELSAETSFEINSVQHGKILSNEFTLPINTLEIKRKESITEIISEKEILNIGTALGNIDESKLKTIRKIFTFDISLDQLIINGLQISRSEPSLANQYTFTLTAKDGYTIEGNSKLDSISFHIGDEMDIKPHEKIVLDISFDEINKFEEVPTKTNIEQIITIRKAFVFEPSITDEQIINGLKVHKTKPDTTNNYTLVLTTNTGFMINGANVLSSNKLYIPFNFDITLNNIAIDEINRSEINSFNRVPTKIEEHQLSTIKKLFNFSNSIYDTISDKQIIDGFKVNITGDLQNRYTIILSLNEGYTIDQNNSKIIESHGFIVKLNIAVEKIDSSLINITENQLKILNDANGKIDLEVLEIIKLAFNITGNTYDELVNGLAFEISSGDSVGSSQIILFPNDNFLINESINSISSNNFMIKNILTISSSSGNPANILMSEIEHFQPTSKPTSPEQLIVLLKSF